MGTADFLRRQKQGVTSADVQRHPNLAPKLGRMFAGGVVPSGLLPWDQRNATEHNQGMVYLSALKNAENIAAATVNVYDTSWAQKNGKNQVRKAFKPDDQAGEATGREACPDHPIAKLFAAPNPVDDQSQFLKKCAFQYYLTGGCLIWDVRNTANAPIEWYVIPRAWAQYQRPATDYPLGYYRVTNNLGWMYQNWTAGLGTTFNLDIRATIRFGDPHALYPGEYYSRLTACAEELDVYFATIRKIASGLRNGVKPGLAFKLTEGVNLSKEQVEQWQAHFEAEFVGVDNAGRTLVTGPFDPVDLQPPEDGSTETRDQNRTQVQRTFGTPDMAFGALETGTYSGNAAVGRAYSWATLRPPCGMIATAVTRRYQPLYGDDFKTEIEPADYDDPEMSMKRSTMLVDMAKSGGASWNEARLSIGLPPRPELDEIQKPQEPGAMPGQDDGGLDLGIGDDTADAGGQDGADTFGSLDLGVGDLSDDQTTGWKDRSQAGRPKPSFSLNGTGAH
jgi:phage portal protein BeeE